MSRIVTGNLTGLKVSHKKALEELYLLQVPESLIISHEVAVALLQISREIGREVGLLIDRQGVITNVFVGEARRIYLPDLGRQRGGATRLRGLRHIHTVFKVSPQFAGQVSGLTPEDLADLTKLRLDLVGTLQNKMYGSLDTGLFSYAYLVGSKRQTSTSLTKSPSGGALKGVELQEISSLKELEQVDFLALVRSSEKSLTEKQTAPPLTKSPRLKTGHSLARLQDRALLVGGYLDAHTRKVRLEELAELAETAGVEVIESIGQQRSRLDPRLVIGKGKLEEVTLRALDLGANLLIFDHDLTPAQARAIAAFTDLRILDRTQLILDIFAQHAHSAGGKLQVELAQLKYNLSRLTDLDTGLSRLTGGIGGRGPGETKLEINRRRARDRIAKLEKAIDKLGKERGLRRNLREKSALPLIVLIGYTNAGKSTLFNRLTGAESLVADRLFATLDPTNRRVVFNEVGAQGFPLRVATLTDTVGFIRDLPPDLLKAFRATLEELVEADLLLQVIDVADPDREAKEKIVLELLTELKLTEIPRLVVYNKADLVPAYLAKTLARKHDGVAVSAYSGEGLAVLKERLASLLWPQA